MTQNERRIWLIENLKSENEKLKYIQIPTDEAEQKQILRGLFNIRPPQKSTEEFLAVQNEYLQEEIKSKTVVDSNNIPFIGKTKLALWKGDITLLKCDSIVNAANSALTGCYVPNHCCIDNCIHTFAGVQLRLACQKIIDEQGHEEETGKAKITPAFNLPCKYVLHTVGPIVQGSLTQNDKALLASSYNSCLKLASEKKLQTVAFCCISTGVFGFPQQQAAEVAIETTQKFLLHDSQIKKVIFNVFKQSDFDIYKNLLEKIKG